MEKAAVYTREVTGKHTSDHHWAEQKDAILAFETTSPDVFLMHRQASGGYSGRKLKEI